MQWMNSQNYFLVNKYKTKMPRKRAAKKTYKKRKRKPTITDLTNKAGSGLTDRARIVFPTQFETTINTGIDNITSFNLNSCWDPLSSAGSKQPPNFDCLVSSVGPWRAFRVYGAKVNSTVVNLSAKPCRAFLYITDTVLDMSLITSYDLQNNSMCMQKILTPSGGASDMVHFSRYFDLVKLFGKKVMVDDTYEGSYNGNPADVIYCYVGVQSLDGASTVNYTMTYDIKQYTILEDKLIENDHTAD